MLDHPLPKVESWVAYFSRQPLPVLRHTKRQLEAAQENIDRVSGQEISRIILQDPLLAVRVISYIQPMTRTKRLHNDVTTIVGAIMMMGVDSFFKRFSQLETLEDHLSKAPPKALLGTLQIVRRAQHASRYAHDWAAWRLDMNAEEVALAALLHDLAEILIYCFAPPLAMSIRNLQQENPQLRSAIAQAQVLGGFGARDIQTALCKAWHLPDLLLQLIDDRTDHPRVKNVALAVNLSRHLAHGWKDPALPDDLKAIAQLLNLSEEALGERLGLAPPEEALKKDLLENPDQDALNDGLFPENSPFSRII